MRGKIRERIRLSKTWRLIVAHAWSGTKATGKRRVTITIILGPRQRGADPDAYFKAVGDALVDCGALVDDSRKWVEWMPVRYDRGKNTGCMIELEDCN
jgi:Holliday junction resolvase RusA-like endonuclease